MSPSSDYQPWDEGLLNGCVEAVRSVDQVTLLPPAAELDSAAAATPALPIVKTVPNDDTVLAGDAACPTSVDTASKTTHRRVVWNTHIVNGDVPMHP